MKNIDILEQSAVIQKGTSQSWGEIDAFFSWDPTIAIFEDSEKARIVALVKPVTLTTMSQTFIEKDQKAAQNFLKSFREAYLYYATHQQEANQWFIDETKFNHPISSIKKMTSLEKNLSAKEIKEIDIKLYDSHIQTMLEIAEEAEKIEAIKKKPEIMRYINTQLLKTVTE